MGKRVLQLCQGLSQTWLLRGKDSIHILIYFLLSRASSHLGQKKAKKAEHRNLCSTVELTEGRYDILV